MRLSLYATIGNVYNMRYMIFPLMLCTGCMGSTCRNRDQIFDRYNFKDSIYRSELAARLQHAKTDIEFSVEGYYKSDAHDLLIVGVHGDDFCAKGIFDITNDSLTHGLLAGLKANKGMGYHGAWLRGVKLSIDTNHNSNLIRLQGLSRLLD